MVRFCPGEDRFFGHGGQASGDGEWAKSHSFWFPLCGWGAGQCGELGTRQEELGELGDEDPDPILRSGLQGQGAQSGVFGGTGPVFTAGALTVTRLQVLNLAAPGVGHKRGQAASGGVGESQLSSWVRAFRSDYQAHPCWPTPQLGHTGQFRNLGPVADVTG